MMPDTDLLYLREDEREIAEFVGLLLSSPKLNRVNVDKMQLLCERLTEARKEIERLRVAAGEEISRVSIDGYAMHNHLTRPQMTIEIRMPEGLFDEVVAENVSVHIEMFAVDHMWISLTPPSGNRTVIEVTTDVDEPLSVQIMEWGDIEQRAGDEVI